MTQLDAGTAAARIADQLSAASIPYAIGGALAMGAHGYPRGTLDVDLNVFVEPDALDPVFAALERAGVRLERTTARQRAERDGMFAGTLEGMRIDVFTPSIPFSRDAERTRTRLVSKDGAYDFLAPEAIVVFKLLFFRGKDRADLERFVAMRGARLDRAYVRRWIAEMMGEGDERVTLWDELTARFPAA